jgi:hypothetical protein
VLSQPCISPVFVPRIHPNLVHPGGMRDDVRRDAIRRLLYLTCPPNGRARAPGTRWSHPNIAVCAHRPFVPPSSPRSPPASVVVTDGESRTLMDGAGSRFSACRAGFRSGALMAMTVPSRFHGAKEERIERIGRPSFGRMRHWRAVRWLERSALTIARRSLSVGRPHWATGWRPAARWRPIAHRSDRSHPSLDRIEAHVVAYQIAPYQHGMVAIMIPHIRFSDRPLNILAVGDRDQRVI